MTERSGGRKNSESTAATGSVTPIDLDKAATHLLEECRMVLPGLQALFGFQMIAVFSPGFPASLGAGERRAHLVAIVLVVTAIVLVMAPAAYHRIAEPRSVSDFFLRIASRLLLSSMLPLALATAIDVYLVSRVVLGSVVVAGSISAIAFAATIALWFLFPLAHRRNAG